MITYVDSSLILRAYLSDEGERTRARTVLDDPQRGVITGSWTRIEATGALVRAARAHRGAIDALLDAFEKDISPAGGVIAVVDADQAELEEVALRLVRDHGIRAMDAWHLACAKLAFDSLADPGEELVFATRDDEQSTVARELGFDVL